MAGTILLADDSSQTRRGADGVLHKPLSSAGLERWLQALPARDQTPAEMLERAVRAAALRGLTPAD